MLLDNQKELVQVIAAKLKRRKPDYVEEMTVSEYPSPVKEEYKHGYEQAAHEIIMSIDKKDVLSLAHSLKNFVEMCSNEDY